MQVQNKVSIGITSINAAKNIAAVFLLFIWILDEALFACLNWLVGDKHTADGSVRTHATRTNDGGG
jgi:hypothetical protein